MNLEDPAPEDKKPLPPPKPAVPKDPPPPPPPPPPAQEPELETLEPEMEGELVLEPVPLHPVEPPKYSIWEKVSPSARRKKQIATMESGSREVLALVRSIRENMDQQVLAQKSLLRSLENLPEAVDSVKALSEYTGQHAEMLKLMHDQMESSLDNHRNMNDSVNRFNDTLMSMDKTTQLLLERAQRSEQQLQKMLRRSQRRLMVMLLLMFLMFGGGLFAMVYSVIPEKTEALLSKWGLPTLTSLRAGDAAAPMEPADLPAPAVLKELEPEPAPAPLLSSEPELPEPEEEVNAILKEILEEASEPEKDPVSAELPENPPAVSAESDGEDEVDASAPLEGESP